ncbi:MAG: DUF4837 family protein [Saprospirales bacterium]|nr:MAG: DUF4837 family protein [Saprospirales bacterium]
MLRFFVILFAFLTLAACGSDVQDRFRSTPTAIGRIQQMNIIADQQLWDTYLSDTFAFYYQGAYLILPQPEPIFDIRVFSTEDVLSETSLRELKLFVKVANLADENSPTTQMVLSDLGKETINESLQNRNFGVQIARDKWARGQLVVYIFGKSIDDIVEGIPRSFDQIRSRIAEFYERTLEAEIFGGGINRPLANLVASKFNADIRIPSNWVLAIEDKDFLWLREEQRNASLSLLFTKVPYEDESQLSPEFLRSLRDSITSERISSGKEGSYMVVEDSYLPTFNFQYNHHGSYTVELRGIWDMRSDFMGGPFKSYLFHRQADNMLIFVDAFVFAPAEDKRNHMIRLEYIVKTLRL